MTATTKPKTDMVPTTPVMATSALNTPEILEMILVQTDMRTLLTSAQRVCRDWLNLITTTPSIQKALFFTPIKASEQEINEKKRNPLLIEDFPPIFSAEDTSVYCGFDFSDLEWTKHPSSLTRFARADASWRKMLVQQPPISGLGIFSHFHAKGGDSAGCSCIPAHEKNQEKNYEGLRMGRLFDILLFTCHVQFERGTSARLYWATETPSDLSLSYGNINVEFHKMLARFGIILYTRKVMQCYVMVDAPLSDSETTRRKIIKAYREQGIDVDSKAREIEGSRGLVEDEKSFSATHPAYL